MIMTIVIYLMYILLVYQSFSIFYNIRAAILPYLSLCWSDNWCWIW